MTEAGSALDDHEWRRLSEADAGLVANLRDVAVLLFDRDLRVRLVTEAVATRHGWPADELLGRNVLEVLPHAQAEQVADHCRGALAGERRTFEAPGVRDQGASMSVTVVPVRNTGGEVAGGMVVAQDIVSDRPTAQALATDRQAMAVIGTNREVTGQQRAEARLAERVNWLEAMRQVTATILDGSSLDATLGLVARFGRVLAGADVAGVTVPTGETGRLRVHSVDGVHADRLRDAELPVDGSVAGEVLSTGRPVVLQNAAADERRSQPVVRIGLFGPAMFVPLQARADVFGTLMVARLSGGRLFDQEELQLVQAFADQAAVAYEYARAQREVQRLAVLADRERIGGELHDAVIQSLFAIGLHLQATASIVGEPEVARRIEAAVEDLDRTMEELRRHIFELRLGIAADRRLDRALHALAADLEARDRIVAVVEVDQPTAAALGDRTTEIIGLLRATLAHPGRSATTCRIRLYRESGRAVLELDDDAPGPPPAARQLRPHAERLAAELDVAADPDGGMTVRARIPLPS